MSSVRTALLRGLLAATLVAGVGVVGAVTAQGADPCDPVHRYTLQTAVIGDRLLDWPTKPL